MPVCPKCGTEFYYFNNIPVIIDEDMPNGDIEFHDKDGRIATYNLKSGKITLTRATREKGFSE